MNDILNRLAVLLALFAFAVVSTVGFAAGAGPMIVLFRATVALVFFGVLGRIGFRVILKGILEELAKQRNENNSEKHKAIESRTSPAVSGAAGQTKQSTNPAAK
jgi:hypothetical protein